MSKSATLRPCFFVIDDNCADLQIFDAALAQIYPDSIRKCFGGGEDLISFLDSPFNQGFKPSAIFVDLNMPEMDGREVLKFLVLDKKINCLIYILSGTVHAELTQELVSLGATGVYEKPADYYEIVDMFSKILNAELVIK